MTNILTLTNPLSSVIEKLLGTINRVCCSQDISFFIAGASAREILIHHVYGRRIGRQTRDIDFAVFVNGWEQFEALKQSFIKEGALAIKGNAHRMMAEGVELDIIPFGDVAEDKQVAWPPDREIIMAVDGFEDAHLHTVRVQLSSGEVLPFCSLPGLALLKLFAWRDRGAANAKDATDLYKIISEYGLIEDERIYELAIDNEKFEWDPVRMGAFLLGNDVAIMSAGETYMALLQLDKEKLIDAVVRQSRDESFQEIDQRVNDFWQGIHTLSF
ncbi:nucleotidyl transferase AbiEii/AbiGii toxin family protein [Erwiniaceae bacterium L1_54_6]|nr:nucleotidyl transferase AbiEii/AbiGii toxin family protein [Erwiniaceae bacterium L1_54_6]